jgi:hypothetical protein
VANALGAGILPPNSSGATVHDVASGADLLAAAAINAETALSEFIVSTFARAPWPTNPTYLPTAVPRAERANGAAHRRRLSTGDGGGAAKRAYWICRALGPAIPCRARRRPSADSWAQQGRGWRCRFRPVFCVRVSGFEIDRSALATVALLAPANEPAWALLPTHYC